MRNFNKFYQMSLNTKIYDIDNDVPIFILKKRSIPTVVSRE